RPLQRDGRGLRRVVPTRTARGAALLDDEALRYRRLVVVVAVDLDQARIAVAADLHALRERRASTAVVELHVETACAVAFGPRIQHAGLPIGGEHPIAGLVRRLRVCRAGEGGAP